MLIAVANIMSQCSLDCCREAWHILMSDLVMVVPFLSYAPPNPKPWSVSDEFVQT